MHSNEDPVHPKINKYNLKNRKETYLSHTVILNKINRGILIRNHGGQEAMDDILKLPTEEDCTPEILYSQKVSFKNER